MARRSLQQPVLLSDSEKDLRLARKDAISALMVWCLLEALSLLLLPSFQLIQGEDRLWRWFSITIPLGLVGAVSIGLSSWWVKWLQENMSRSVVNKPLYVSLAQGLGFMGLVGIGFPMIMVGLELWLSMLRGGAR